MSGEIAKTKSIGQEAQEAEPRFFPCLSGLSGLSRSFPSDRVQSNYSALSRFVCEFADGVIRIDRITDAGCRYYLKKIGKRCGIQHPASLADTGASEKKTGNLIRSYLINIEQIG